MVNLDIKALRSMAPEDRVKALLALERKRKDALKKEQEEAEKDVKVAETMIQESLDEVAIQAELRKAREELKGRKVVADEVVASSREKKEEATLEETVSQVPVSRGEQRMYLDLQEELERIRSGERKPSRRDLGELYSALKSVEKNVEADVYGRAQDTSELYHVQDTSGVWQKVHEMPNDGFGYKERMEAVLDHIYSMRKHSKDVYERSDHT